MRRRRAAVEKEGDRHSGESLNTPPIGAASKRRRATTAAVTTPADGYKSEFFMQHAGPVGPLGMFLVVPAISVRQNAVRGGGKEESRECTAELVLS